MVQAILRSPFGARSSPIHLLREDVTNVRGSGETATLRHDQGRSIPLGLEVTSQRKVGLPIS
jgi:hypothetical protein